MVLSVIRAVHGAVGPVVGQPPVRRVPQAARPRAREDERHAQARPEMHHLLAADEPRAAPVQVPPCPVPLDLVPAAVGRPDRLAQPVGPARACAGHEDGTGSQRADRAQHPVHLPVLRQPALRAGHQDTLRHG
jgi:hypothetical protein